MTSPPGPTRPAKLEMADRDLTVPTDETESPPENGTDEVVEQRTRYLRSLLEINRAVVTELDRESLLGAIADALRGLVAFERIELLLVDEEPGYLRVEAVGDSLDGTRRTVGIRAPLAATPAGCALENDDPIRIEDVAELARPLCLEPLHISGLRSLLLAPLRHQGRPLGVLLLGNRDPHRYSDRETEIVVGAGQQIGLALANLQAYEEISRLRRRLEEEKLYLEEEIRTEHGFDEFVGNSPPVRKVLAAAAKVAGTDAAVLLTGETGTGKGLVARAIHEMSPRSGRTLVQVNCAALPAELVESELFGHEAGAFTGATSRKAGRFELADGGTLFLDEVGDLPLPLQAKLLTGLQDGTFQRVGGTRTLSADTRILAATNRDLAREVETGRFRSDLYYRLAVFPITLPPLRERIADLPALVRHFVLKHAGRMSKKIDTIPKEALRALGDYPWPGNVRELENLVERAVILSPGSRLALESCLPRPQDGPRTEAAPTLDAVQRDHILEVLEATRWKVSGPRGAAETLGLKPTTLESKMKKLGIVRPPRSSWARKE